MKCTDYFKAIRTRPDRCWILDAWIQATIDQPDREHIQGDGRIRRWKMIHEADGRVLRVKLLSDGETVHNAFFDRDVS